MGLAFQVGNSVTLSYRQSSFSRIKDRNTQRLNECVRKGKLKVIFNSSPVEFTKDEVALQVADKTQRIPNDFVWIFAGGEPPTAFLKKIGVGLGSQDLTSQGKQATKETKAELVPAD
jgi:thioredoxin reductase (NADPH)